jgi:uncharacterized membrane protein HdeD (DUF308 family)
MPKKLNKNDLSKINIITGSLIIIFSIIVLIYSISAFIGLLLIIAGSFLLMGIARLLNAGYDDTLSKKALIAKFSTGILSIVLALIVLILLLVITVVLITLLIYIFCFLFLSISVSRIIVGINIKAYKDWYRGLIIGTGIITFILNIIILFYPIIDYVLFLRLLSISFFLNGLIRLLLGLINIQK